jgi:N-acetylmuramoyl-L-alanine amidase
MRDINNIVLHCTATPQNTSVASIQRHWREVNKWRKPGYHFIILPDGKVINLLPIEEVSNGVAGHNSDSIHISYIGGVEGKGRAVDNRTDAQKESQIRLLLDLKKRFPDADIKGHRDFPGVTKGCPSFDVKTWLVDILFEKLLAA